ncbi:flagellar outer arm dynein light chain 1 [Micromonas pusilla CCMP1545]|uniref:Dynein axonemal light chain 1 n=1 Tax=Micromonas pusilla (strain CCMP1545) TaxID=564608 RepID=C1MJK7_MICPC|nr:flagellar outer arm dynein light chain 1 [Micromonas pusilla CCMP1545]EEH59605.1 flagellar outer arm dynein light chain 1 [Micromonas pusilla CCMP1545]|eukprot:XP_003056229.1 flagellar outer arm dynein light chain 1 [Micromonas pusilla CCMP1545]
MAKATTCKDAIKALEAEKGVVAAEQEKVLLFAKVPPIEKMDGSLSTLKACAHLSLSTNNIEKISALSGLDNLKILRRVLLLGKNLIKKIENLDGVAATLEELWISYNNIEKLTNIDKLTNLRVLYMSNNKVADFKELEKLSSLANLSGAFQLLLVGNPVYTASEDAQSLGSEYRIEVLKRVPQLVKLDGVPVDVDEKEKAKEMLAEEAAA